MRSSEDYAALLKTPCIACQSDSNLLAGNLSSAEVKSGLADLERRSRALVSPS